MAAMSITPRSTSAALGAGRTEQIFIQPQAPPWVWRSSRHATTGDKFYLDAAQAAAEAMVWAAQSGGWAQVIDFDPRGAKAASIATARRGRNHSTFDDGISQSALRFLYADHALGFKHAAIHEASEFARKAMLAAASERRVPQVWTGPQQYPAVKASFPVIVAPRTASKTTGTCPPQRRPLHLHRTPAGRRLDDLPGRRCKAALASSAISPARRCGPQPGWAQQYDFKTPIWARKFSRPRSRRGHWNAIETLLQVHRVTATRSI